MSNYYRGIWGALVVLAGFGIFRNRFAIQRRLESWGWWTPNLGKDLSGRVVDVKEAAKSLGAKFTGKTDRVDNAVGGMA